MNCLPVFAMFNLLHLVYDTVVRKKWNNIK